MCSRYDIEGLAYLVLAAVAVGYLVRGLVEMRRNASTMRTADAGRIAHDSRAALRTAARTGSNPLPAGPRPPAPPSPPACNVIDMTQEDLDPKVRAVIALLARRTAQRDHALYKKQRANPYAPKTRKAVVWAIEYQATWAECQEVAAQSGQPDPQGG